MKAEMIGMMNGFISMYESTARIVRITQNEYLFRSSFPIFTDRGEP